MNVKIKTLCLILFCCFTPFLWAKQLKISEIKIKPVNCEWSEWIKTNGLIDVDFNPDQKNIIIHSKTEQIYVYDDIEKYFINGNVIYVGDAIDKNNQISRILLIINEVKKEILLTISYLDGEFKYKIIY